MSKIRLYLDEDSIRESFIQALRSRNIDVLTAAEVGMLNKTDEEQLAWATEHNRVIFSFNIRDFYRLHTMLLEREESHGGIVLAPQQQYGIGDLLRGVLQIINIRSAEAMVGQLEFLSNWIPDDK
jgi:hypothetical protein